MKNYHTILGVSRDATPTELSAAFKKLAKELHPDVNASTSAAKRFLEVKEAYEALKAGSQRHIDPHGTTFDSTVYYDPVQAESVQRRAKMFQKEHLSSDVRKAMRHMQRVLRPKLIYIIPFIALASWWFVQSVGGKDSYREPDDKVIAWYNEKTKRWEVPDPHNPAFTDKSHRLCRIPAKDVAGVRTTANKELR